MGNCQAAEAATVVIQHPGPGGKVERIYWSVSASEVMGSNPGHYVAVIVAAPPQASPSSSSSTTAASQPQQRHLKLLRPDDTLLIGHVYRLISFEEVLKEFASKKNVKLSRVLLKQQQRKEKDGSGNEGKKKRKEKGTSRSCSRDPAATDGAAKEEEQQQQLQQDDELQRVVEEQSSLGVGVVSRRHSGQWRPALQSIAEVGS